MVTKKNPCQVKDRHFVSHSVSFLCFVSFPIPGFITSRQDLGTLAGTHALCQLILCGELCCFSYPDWTMVNRCVAALIRMASACCRISICIRSGRRCFSGVGEGGAGGATAPPLLKVGGGTAPPTFWTCLHLK